MYYSVVKFHSRSERNSVPTAISGSRARPYIPEVHVVSIVLEMASARLRLFYPGKLELNHPGDIPELSLLPA